MGRLLTGIVIGLSLLALPEVARAGTFLERQLRHGRVRAAFDERAGGVEEAFRRAGAAWPPRGVFLRSFKLEAELEVWAAPEGDADRWVRVWSLPVCASSGELGPKRHQGDLQVPEGFYEVDRFNPRSRFHLSLGLSYPNAVDRRRAGAAHPGGDIFVHGDCVTIGCLPLGDARMEDLYLAAVLARDGGQRHLPVHIFPCRLDERACHHALAAAGAADPELARFWRDLLPGYLAFARDREPPHVVAGRDGTYRMRAR